MTHPAKTLYFVGSARKDLKSFPADVQDELGHALWVAQMGGKHEKAKPLAGFGGAGVLEVVENFDGDTFRAVYTVRFESSVFVLHAFQKKSKKGVTTPKQDIDLIKARLRKVEEFHAKQAP